MHEAKVTAVSDSVATTHEWFHDIEERIGIPNEQCAYHALRGVLFALRDRLTPEEAVHLGDQLPMLIRGIYYEGYTLGGKPEKIRSEQEFLERIANETVKINPQITPDTALRAVSATLAERISAGQYKQVKEMLPMELRRQMH